MRRFVLPIVVLSAAFGLFAVYLTVENFTGNFHEVVAGEVYRSAQFATGDITRYQKEYGIKTILNLRGKNPGAYWYESEEMESEHAGITHLDFRMSSSHELTTEEALSLIQVMRNAPKPMLIHCRAGADRTGLASAFYVAAVAKRGEWAAERQLWADYGHLPLRINASYAMNRTFERMEPIFGYGGS